jgi:hypothetical protein
MPALITAYQNGKRRLSRCDATCYTARSVRVDRCACICGGANHGVGLTKAIANTAALQGDWKTAYRKAHKGPITFKTADQIDLFVDV